MTNGYLYRIADKCTALQLQAKLSILIKSSAGKNVNFSTAENNDTPLYRYANIQKQGVCCAYVIASNLQPQGLDWMQHLLDIKPDTSVERSIISGQMEGKLAQGKIVCACKQVSENSIKDAITAQQSPNSENIGQCTGAGTGCGSCIPDIEQLIEAETLSYSVA